ncbi:hypothetical protein HDIA_2596 [Hartmannibacter diazotrophicus]|uniref:DUF6898 domain-containing protein n=1 Tax=Hartmannibacter diazotrophicus TaxID=1482074 RepID=A0A2C9D766_9HYPH|nr:serine hydroxymethyltransferase [Hartmannibacter diazotrophicus]SON56137.1 hypothetical protein HDIA_2596 [Hartmannibacter diazotrophicus]
MNEDLSKLIYFEFRPIGRQMRVTAIDGQSGAEAVVIAPIGAPRRDLEQLAARKLRRSLEMAGNG